MSYTKHRWLPAIAAAALGAALITPPALSLGPRSAPGASAVQARAIVLRPGDHLRPPSIVKPAALCGSRWVAGDYVLAGNCSKACISRGHSPVQCRLRLVPLCRTCWAQLLACANRPEPPRIKCQACSQRYAACMRSFFGN